MTVRLNSRQLKQEIPFTDEELAAIDDGIVLMEKLCEKLADVPTPSGQTPRQIEEKTRRALPILR
jgi:hypothetical protein